MLLLLCCESDMAFKAPKGGCQQRSRSPQRTPGQAPTVKESRRGRVSGPESCDPPPADLWPRPLHSPVGGRPPPEAATSSPRGVPRLLSWQRLQARGAWSRARAAAQAHTTPPSAAASINFFSGVSLSLEIFKNNAAEHRGVSLLYFNKPHVSTPVTGGHALSTAPASAAAQIQPPSPRAAGNARHFLN
jgi:hypothetical protein